MLRSSVGNLPRDKRYFHSARAASFLRLLVGDPSLKETSNGFTSGATRSQDDFRAEK